MQDMHKTLPAANDNRGFFSTLVALPRRLPIAYKMAVSFSLLIILGMGALGAAVIHYQEDLMRRQIESYGATIVGQYAATAIDPVFTDNQFDMQVLTANLVKDHRIEGAALVDPKGERLAGEGLVPEPLVDYVPHTELQSVTWQGQSLLNVPHQLVSFFAPVQFRQVTAGQAIITLSLADVQYSFRQTIHTLLAATALMMLFSVIIAYWMGKRMGRPIKTLVMATDELGQGNLNVQLPEDRGDEFGRLNQAVNRMVRNMREKNQVEGVLNRLVAGDVAQQVLSDLNDVGIGSQRVEASVLFVDIVGFTSLSERLAPEVVVDLLNEYFAYFTQCSQLYMGMVDKFIGDCAMIIFGAPRPNPDHRFDAIACAVMIQRLLERVNKRRHQLGQPRVCVRIGINSGEMMAGMVGADQRMEYTVVGDAVNLASRLCSLGQPDDIVVGGDVIERLERPGRVTAEPFRQMKVKGVTAMVSAYRIEALASRYEQSIDEMIDGLLTTTDQPPKAI
ncbi:HAMP domain-containing protein [Exilibacterium tricleocarpae]|uniref:HAMP domain-containing protein n=1 Tax=Exilibacterium tricleocarpae TaxID=2591008 RepID=A0A545U3X4_9GAMM|nr:adenylate/guanylate cyclase domain-containing protein [Exilibacterium tricleocarpae]TQV84113.1 HAMP domain-containing protein [Exilibacterium tricleocarpae]